MTRSIFGILGLCALTMMTGRAEAGRISGTASATYTYAERKNDQFVVVDTNDTAVVTQQLFDHLDEEYLLVNYDDILFYKNRIRFSANINRRELSETGVADFRPIYSFDLRSYGYAMSISYTPYRQSISLGTESELGKRSYLYYRDWRSNFSVAFPSYPSVTLVVNSARSFDKEPVRRKDGRSRNLILETRYIRSPLALRMSYQNIRQEQKLSGNSTSLIDTYTGSANFSKSMGGLGYLSTTYTYYRSNTALSNRGPFDPATGQTHSVSTIANSRAIWKLSSTGSYSGRFQSNRSQNIPTENSNQTMSGQLSLAPTDYLTLSALKAYQIGARLGSHDIVEYVTFSGNTNRYLRRGVDTRLGVSRTIFQQSTAIVTNSVRRGHHTLDTYYGSLGLDLYTHLRSLTDMTVSRNSEPTVASQKYLVSYSLNIISELSRHLNAQLTTTALYSGAKLQFGHTYSQNYNAGLNFNPSSNLNFNVTYLYATRNGLLASKNGSFSGYASYSFRRAYSLYVSYQRDNQEITSSGGESIAQGDAIKPYTLNCQVLMYMSRRTTLSVSYLYNRAGSQSGLINATSSVQTQINMQL